MNTISDLKNVLINYINNSGANELVIILNGEYVTSSSKLVYTNYSGASEELSFYIKYKDDDGTWTTKNVSRDVLNSIYDVVRSNSFGGFKFDDVDTFDCTKISVSVKPNLGFLIIESLLYSTGRKLMESGSNNVTVSISGKSLSPENVRTLRSAFQKKSFEIYQNLIYNKVHSRIISKIYRKNSFYNILKTFVPVFVNVNGLYNPFFDDVSSTAYKQTLLYKMAVEKDRLVTVGDVSCYMLTHREICEAFQMTSFMRFSPEFVYRIYVGLLHPEYENFPNKQHKVFIPPVNATSIQELKSHYSQNAFVVELQKYEDLYNNEQNVDDKKNYGEIRDRLMGYSEIDTLRYACILNRKILTAIGPSVLDKSVSERDLYNIIFEAKI